MVLNRAVGPKKQASTLNPSEKHYCNDPPPKHPIQPELYIRLFGRAVPQMNYKMFTGYIPINNENFFFYWYFGPRDGNVSSPLVLYSNGGPGCSSMEAATTENSPLFLQAISESCNGFPSDCDYTNQFSSNPYGWNAHAHLLYVDQPRGVGYSYGLGPPANSTQMGAHDMLSFLVKWYTHYPELKKNSLIISGESYSGHYLPSWSSSILSYNRLKSTQTRINLRGVMIGNGWIDAKIQNYQALATFAKRSNLVPPNWESPEQSAVKTDDNDDGNTRLAGLHETISSYAGFTPNEYDIRQRLIVCEGCMGYNYTAWTLFFQRDDVKTALGVCAAAHYPAFEVAAQGCLSTIVAGVNFDADDTFDYKAAIASALDAGVKVLLYYGQQDTVCNYVGGEAVAAAIPWSNRQAFNALDYSPLTVAGITVGSIKTLGHLTLALVQGSGHMVPADEPATAASLLREFLLTIEEETTSSSTPSPVPTKAPSVRISDSSKGGRDSADKRVAAGRNAGIAIGVLAALLLIGVSVYHRWRRTPMAAQEQTQQDEVPEPSLPRQPTVTPTQHQISGAARRQNPASAEIEQQAL